VLVRSLVVAVVVACAATAGARELIPVIPQPIVLRLTGHLELDRDAARAKSRDVVELRSRTESRWLAVDRAVTLDAYSPTGRAVLDMLAPFQSRLEVAGAGDLRTRLLEAPAGEIVTVEGVVDRGSRTYLLRDVQLGAPQTSP
jgi:hypothetical protein